MREWRLRLRGFRRGYSSLERRIPRRLRRELFDPAFRRRNPLEAAFADRWGYESVAEAR